MYDHDPVGVPYVGQPVGYYQRRLVAGLVPERPLDVSFDPGVDIRGRFVEYQEPGVFRKRLPQRDELLFSRRDGIPVRLNTVYLYRLREFSVFLI